MNLYYSENFIRKPLTPYKITGKEIIMFSKRCPECDAELDIPDDLISGEIISCPECGLDYESKLKEDGKLTLKPAEIEGEDWGE